MFKDLSISLKQRPIESSADQLDAQTQQKYLTC